MFLRNKFSGGIHPPTYKELTQNCPIEEIPPPQKVVIPLIQHIGGPCLPLVKSGEEVKLGQKIGSSDKYISSPVHASLGGKVSHIEDFNHPVLGKSPAIFIERGQDSYTNAISQKDPTGLSPEELKKIIQEAGIVGLGGAGFPTHVKLSPPKPIEVLILNAAECEPYLTCDERLLCEKPSEILKGLEIIIKIISPQEIFLGIEDNKEEAIGILKNTLQAMGLTNKIKMVILKTKYPQGGEKQLIKAITGKEVPSGGLPFDVGVLVQNVQTAFAIYEAVYKGKPLYERVITVSGKAIKKRGNFKVRIGTLVSEIVEFCGGFIENPKKIIFGGPMMGIAQWSLEVPVIKGTSGILFLSEEELNFEEPGPCIRCGRCIEVCPAKIMPASIALAGEYKRWNIVPQYHPLDCIECGACSYICPTRRDLVQFIKLAKQYGK